MFKWNFVYSLVQKNTFCSLKAILKTPTTVQSKTPAEILKEYGYGYGKKIIYNSKIEQIKAKMGFKSYFQEHVKTKNYKQKLEQYLQTVQPLPIILKYLDDDISKTEENVERDSSKVARDIPSELHEYINFPLAFTQTLNDNQVNEQTISQNETKTMSIDELIKKKYELLKTQNNWMTSYDNFEYDLEESEQKEAILSDWTVNYGTSNPNSIISNTPCGGCGALLHCKVIINK